MIKIDLHTHSSASHDGGITLKEYEEIIKSEILDVIAITDHNRIDFALIAQQKLGNAKIIVGEEISTTSGDIIGLFLTKPIESGLTIEQAIKKIKAQQGIVYVPHPFETVRKGINEDVMNRIKTSIDLIESANGRAYFQNFGPKAHAWAHINNIPALASSDAHRAKSLGKTYSAMHECPTAENLIKLSTTARKIYSKPKIVDILAPKLNKLKKRLKPSR